MRTLLPFLLMPFFSADGAGGSDGGGGGDPGKGDGAGQGQDAARGGQGPGAGALSEADIDARVEARVQAALAAREKAAAAAAAVDKHWEDTVWKPHNIPEAVRPLVRSQWDALPVEDGKERPNPAEWAPAQPWFGALKPIAPAAPATQSGKRGATEEQAAKPADPAKSAEPAKTPAASNPTGAPSWLTRPASPANGARGPATNPREARARVIESMRRAD